jgi:hypothetical protein
LRLSDGRQSHEQVYDHLAEHGYVPPSLAGFDGCNAEFVPGMPDIPDATRVTSPNPVGVAISLAPDRLN